MISNRFKISLCCLIIYLFHSYSMNGQSIDTNLDLQIKSGKKKNTSMIIHYKIKNNDRYLLKLNDTEIPFQLGIVYQPVPNGSHINDFKNNFHLLYKDLLDESDGGKGHAAILKKMGITFIRLYELPSNNSLYVRDQYSRDVYQIKNIFRKVHEKYGIYFIIGTYAGLYQSVDFAKKEDLDSLYSDVMQLITTYYLEPWVLGWQLGNENNYHVLDGRFRPVIKVWLNDYYELMDNLAGAMRDALSGIDTPKGKLNPSAEQIIILGNGDLSDNEIPHIAKMNNIDVLGLNVYRDIQGLEKLIASAYKKIQKPLIISEFGIPAANSSEQIKQAEYIKEHINILMKHSPGFYGFGNILAAVICEATDQAWKIETQNPSYASLGVFNKMSQHELIKYSNNIENRLSLMPKTWSPEDILLGSWKYLEELNYDDAIGFSEKIIELYSDIALLQEIKLKQYLKGINKSIEDFLLDNDFNEIINQEYWALNTVGAAHFIRAKSYYALGQKEKANIEMRILLKNFPDSCIKDKAGNVTIISKLIDGNSPTLIFEFSDISCSSLLIAAWQALEKKQYEKARSYAQLIINLYSNQAKLQEEYLLKERIYPEKSPDIERNWALNSVGTAYYIRGDSYYKQLNRNKALLEFKVILDNYSFAHIQDIKGEYWKLKDAIYSIFPLFLINSIPKQNIKD